MLSNCKVIHLVINFSFLTNIHFYELFIVLWEKARQEEPASSSQSVTGQDQFLKYYDS